MTKEQDNPPLSIAILILVLIAVPIFMNFLKSQKTYREMGISAVVLNLLGFEVSRTEPKLPSGDAKWTIVIDEPEATFYCNPASTKKYDSFVRAWIKREYAEPKDGVSTAYSLIDFHVSKRMSRNFYHVFHDSAGHVLWEGYTEDFPESQTGWIDAREGTALEMLWISVLELSKIGPRLH